ncbi:hypothetical protein [Synechococcus sp. EJ6-Ellesmere]|uniref:hypothetical protein n=1 Tax=Synechococcus sp. EJ6-Ellesmere TaxID=2823734 RepID=UPI0020CC95AE|nr:hypothetical protein [Synechococcus sp. EJ6-Ellesmere]MCP9826280.1 hypothetical protein [Synechococcus sp. EJ6-Ellesmere]
MADTFISHPEYGIVRFLRTNPAHQLLSAQPDLKRLSAIRCHVELMQYSEPVGGCCSMVCP